MTGVLRLFCESLADIRRRTIILVTLLLMVIPFGAIAAQSPEPATLTISTAPVSGPLSLEERVACQTAIEAVYWQQRIWPEANPGSKPALSEVMPQAAIEAKVIDSLAKSQALAEVWGQPITAEMLQAEINRMARSTRQPEQLGRLWAALNNDPALVAECLARPPLANRLLENFFGGDPRFAEQSLGDWWAATKGTLSAEVETPVATYQLPAIQSVGQQDDTWTDTPSIPLIPRGRSVWTGSEMLYLGNFSTLGYRYDPATDTWQTMTTINMTGGFRDFSAVWTGTELITWGGCTANNHNCTVSLGFKYNPMSDTWTPIANGPFSRTDHSAVWTGSEMLVWGGCTYFNNLCQVFSTTGGRYDPVSNSWQLMNASGAPAGRTFPNLLWTGDEMLAWGGCDDDDDSCSNAATGGRYDPATDSWAPMSTSGAPIGRLSSAVWTGSEMIAWGGCSGAFFCDTAFNTGGRYDPTSNSWTPTSTANAPSARWSHEAVWTGTEMLIWGGENSSGYQQAGGRYDPATDSWSSISTTGAPTGRIDHQMLWTGDLMLVWGGPGMTGFTQYDNGARYNPASNSWTPISQNDPDSFRVFHTAVWTGAEMIVWGGNGDGMASTGLDTGRIYNPALNSWDATSTVGAPSGRDSHTAVWTGTEMIIWGGDSFAVQPGTGGRYNPVSDSWTPTGTSGAPIARSGHIAVWTGTEMVVWGGSTWDSLWVNTGGRYDPSSNSWQATTTSGAPQGRNDAGVVWTGSEVIIWGGYGSVGQLGTGGRYSPANNSWSAVSNTNAPSARSNHSVIWTGDEMIVWGGAEDFSPSIVTNTGGRYDPVSNSWSATSTSGAPSARAGHTAVWTGSEMIIWGGGEGFISPESGGRYDPAADSWMATTLNNVPEGRTNHTTVWTGDEMIVWGGNTQRNGYTNTGGRYVVESGLPDGTMHVGDILTGFRPFGDGYQAGVRIPILDEVGAGVPDALVSLEVTTPGGNIIPANLVTNANGHAQAVATTNQTGTYTICVTNVTKDGWLYNPDANQETCETLTIIP